MFSERSGVVNIGLEGMMLTGAFFGIWADDKVGLVGGRAPVRDARRRRCWRSIHAFFAIHLRADQIVSGTAINFLALGITGYRSSQIYGDKGTPAEHLGHPGRDDLDIPSSNFFAHGVRPAEPDDLALVRSCSS